MQLWSYTGILELTAANEEAPSHRIEKARTQKQKSKAVGSTAVASASRNSPGHADVTTTAAGLASDEGSTTGGSQGGKHGLSGGAVAGLVVGVVAACAVAGLLGLLLFRRRKPTAATNAGSAPSLSALT